MNVHEAIASRRSVRDFLRTPVPGDTIRRVLSAAARAPSGGNLQPWHVDVLAGDALERLKAVMRERLAQPALAAEPTEYDIYPKNLIAPYRDRRFKIGEDMYAKVGIPREDKEARRRWFSRNFQFFGAPLALFCSIDRRMGPPQWSDLGMFLQSVMLLLREGGLDSCPQECWSLYPKTVGDFLGLPSERMLFVGMSIGYCNSDSAVNQLVTDRAPLEEFARFHGL
jgi:nitroreductase